MIYNKKGTSSDAAQVQKVESPTGHIPEEAAPEEVTTTEVDSNDSISPVATGTVVPGAIVSDFLPEAVPEAQILSQYAQQGYKDLPVATPVARPIAGGHFYTADEIQVLNQQPIPLQVGNSPGQLPANSSSNVILRPGDGAIPVIAGAYSGAKYRADGMKRGIVSRDPILNNKEEIVKFFNYHGISPPDYYMCVEGYHYETRSSTDQDGNTTYHTDRVTDFNYTVNLTGFVYPYGKITTKDSIQTVEEMIEAFLEDGNRLKSLQLKKKIYWNSEALCKLVRRYIRELGWHRELSVWTKRKNKSVRVAVDSKLAKMYDSRAGRALMGVTVLPLIVTAIYASGHRERGLLSIFHIRYTPLQVFDMIRNKLWIPRRRSGCCIM